MPPPATAAQPPIDLSDIPNAAPINGGTGHMVGKGGLDISDIPDAAPESKFKDPRTHAREVDAKLKGHEPVMDALQGFGNAALGTVQTLASPVRKLFGMQPATPPDQPTTTAGKVGAGAEQMAEFAVPEALAGKVSALLKVAPTLRAAGYSKLVAQYGKVAVEAALKGLGSYGTAKLQGSDNAGTVGAIAAASPIAGQVLSDAVPVLRQKATASMARVLGAGGDSTKRGAAALAKDVDKVVPAALDMGLPTSWSKWADAAQAGRTDAGQALEAAKAGPAGDQLVRLQPVRDAIDQFVLDHGTHLVPPKGFVPGAPMSGAAGGVTPVLYHDDLVAAAKDLSKTLAKYPGGYVQARQLHDIKQMWDAAVFTGPTAGQAGFDLGSKLKAVDKLATLSASNAIRDVLQTDAPTISDLDKVVSRQIKLHQVITKAAQASSGPSMVKDAASKGGTLIGGAAGGYIGGWHGAAIGSLLGGVTGRMLKMAIESPMWRAMPAVMRTAVADAIASGKPDQVRRVLTPIVAGLSSRAGIPSGSGMDASSSAK